MDNNSSKTTTDHAVIKKWIEERGGRPAIVASTEDKSGGGLLRVDFGEPDSNLQEIPWDEFFRTFDERNLEFLYQETTHGEPSRFFKFVSREK